MQNAKRRAKLARSGQIFVAKRPNTISTQGQGYRQDAGTASNISHGQRQCGAARLSEQYQMCTSGRARQVTQCKSRPAS